jgi:hypothetical protein
MKLRKMLMIKVGSIPVTANKTLISELDRSCGMVEFEVLCIG